MSSGQFDLNRELGIGSGKINLMKIGTITLRQETLLLGKPSKLREPMKKV